jgi:hypothetical protein
MQRRFSFNHKIRNLNKYIPTIFFHISIINDNKNIKKKNSAIGIVFWFCGRNGKIFINYVFFNEKIFQKIF